MKTSKSSSIHRKSAEKPVKSSTVNLPRKSSTKPESGSPDKDWQKWYRPPTSQGHYLWETTAEKEAKQASIKSLLESAPKTPDRIDAARLKNVLFELNIHFRVAILLPILLSSEDQDKLSRLGEDVNRTLNLIKLQTDLAVNILTNVPEKTLAGSLTSSERSQDSGLTDSRESVESVEEKQETKEERLRNRLSLAVTSNLFPFKEAFYSLCVAFRNTCDYDLLLEAEKMFAGQLTEMKNMATARQLCGLTADMMDILLNGIETAPFEAREVQKVIAHMTKLNTEAEGAKKLMWDEFQKTLDNNRIEHEQLEKNIEKNQQIIAARLRELHEVRLKAQVRIHRQAEDDNGLHRSKLAKMEKESYETQQLVDSRNKQYLKRDKEYLRQMREAQSAQRQLEIAVLEKCVAIKTEIMALQDRGEILRDYLAKDLKEEITLEVEMNELLRDRRERDERRRLAKAEALRRNRAAIMIQKTWRGFATRKKMKKKKKKGKSKGKGKSKSASTKKKPASTKKK